MTKLQKVNEFTGKLEDLYPTLIIVGGKNIAIPIDKRPIVTNLNPGIGDIVHIRYDDRGYLLDIEIVEKGKPGEQPKPKLPEEKKPGAIQGTEVPRQPVPVKEYVSLRERLFVHQTTYKENCETVREMMVIPDEVLDEKEFNRIMDIALTRAKADAKALIEAAGEGK
jgi:hypothetical protein